MRNKLPIIGPYISESAIVNLDDKDGPGTHWVACKKIGNDVEYFDSFGICICVSAYQEIHLY